jgi:hypothetical protein
VREELRVEPGALRTVSDQQAQVGADLLSAGVGHPLTGAGGALTGLRSADACQFAGSVLAAVAERVGADLSRHSDKLTSAAGLYENTDSDLGSQLSGIIA